MSWLVFRSRRMAVLFLLGFSSGLPLMLTGQTLNAWLTAEGLPLSEITTFSVVGLAYTFKFAWAPLLDRYRLPFLGRRRGWIIVTQVALLVAIVGMGLVDPATSPGVLFGFALAVAILSASQDIVIDGYKADVLSAEERAAGAATYVFGYRVAMLVSSTVALFLAEVIPWRVTYSVIGALMLVGIVTTLFAEEPAEPDRAAKTIVEAIYLPFVELFKKLGVGGAIAVLVFVAIYKFGDSFVQPVLMTFFIRELGFGFAEIGTINKVLGFAGMFLGGAFAGVLVATHGLRRTLFVFGVLQASTNLLYAWLATTGPNYPIWGTAVFLDNVAGAMGTAAFVAFLMSVCTPGVSATQYALLTSLSSVGQRVFGPLTDEVIVRLDAQGIAHLAATSGTIDQAVTPAAQHAVASFDWGQLAPLGDIAARLARGLNPLGNQVILHEQWGTFFVVTTLMAIPGLILALVVARPRE